MILKKKSVKKKKSKKLIYNFLIFYFLVTFTFGIVLISLIINSQLVKNKFNFYLSYLANAGRIEYIYLFDIGINALKSNFLEIERIDMNLGFKNIIEIESQRNLAIKNESLGLKDNLKLVNAEFVYKNQKYKGQIRLKGDRKMHFEKKKHSSYNVYLDNGNFIMGMNRFAIQKPGTRNYIHEWIFHEMIGDLGLIKSNYVFFDLYVNGENQGLYTLEEKMSKELIERNKKRNGPIFSSHQEFFTDADDYIYQIYNEKFWSRPENISISKIANKKLKAFIKGEATVEETFDIDKMAAFFAVMDATYSLHAIFWNSKLYYNPITGLFEPIARDAHRNLPNYHSFNKNYYDRIILDSFIRPETRAELGGYLQIPEGRLWWIKKFFLKKDGRMNVNFTNSYLDHLKKISSESYLKKFFDLRSNQIKKINSHIYSDYFFYASTREYGSGLYYYKKDDLFHRAKVIRDRINSFNKKINFSQIDTNTFKFNITDEKQIMGLTGGKPSINSLRLKSLNCDFRINNKFNYNKKIDIDKQMNFFYETIIKVNQIPKKNIDCKEAIIEDNITGKIYFVKKDKINSPQDFKEFHNKKEEKFKTFFDVENNILKLKNNITIINQKIFIPKNYQVILKPNQELILINNAFIISESPWICIGKEDNSVIIRGEKNNFGGGILIKDTKQKSKFINVEIRYLAGWKNEYRDKYTKKIYSSTTYFKNFENMREKIFIKKDEIQDEPFVLYGSINFYDTNVEINKLKVEKISSEDGLNIINSDFSMKNTSFSEIASDAIDFDFSKGNIIDSEFNKIGNDGLDFSGSNVYVENIYFDNVNDKQISIGENSKIKLNKIYGINSYIGIASKDGSITEAENIFFENVKLPFLSYIKKNEYKKSIVYLTNVKLTNYLIDYLNDKYSQIYVNEKLVGKENEFILPIVYKKNLNLLKL